MQMKRTLPAALALLFLLSLSSFAYAGDPVFVSLGDNDPGEHYWGYSGAMEPHVTAQWEIFNSTEVVLELDSLKVALSGTGDDSVEVSTINIFLDNDNDGEEDAGDTFLGQATVNSDDDILLIEAAPGAALIDPFKNINLLVVYLFKVETQIGSTFKHSVYDLKFHKAGNPDEQYETSQQYNSATTTPAYKYVLQLIGETGHMSWRGGTAYSQGNAIINGEQSGYDMAFEISDQGNEDSGAGGYSILNNDPIAQEFFSMETSFSGAQVLLRSGTLFGETGEQITMRLFKNTLGGEQVAEAQRFVEKTLTNKWYYFNFSAVCGNGVYEEGEACEGTNFGGKACSDFEDDGGYFDGGFLQCTEECAYDLIGCVYFPPPGCGNWIIDEGEECEIMNMTCQPPEGFWTMCEECMCVYIEQVCGDGDTVMDEECEVADECMPPEEGFEVSCNECVCVYEE